MKHKFITMRGGKFVVICHIREASKVLTLQDNCPMFLNVGVLYSATAWTMRSDGLMEVTEFKRDRGTVKCLEYIGDLL